MKIIHVQKQLMIQSLVIVVEKITLRGKLMQKNLYKEQKEKVMLQFSVFEFKKIFYIK